MLLLGLELIDRSHKQNFGEREVAERVLRDFEHSQQAHDSHLQALQIACQSDVLLSGSVGCTTTNLRETHAPS